MGEHAKEERRPRGYGRFVWFLYQRGWLRRLAFRRPCPDCHPPALTWFGRRLLEADYHLHCDSLGPRA